MSTPGTNQTRGESIPAIERATGRAWPRWIAIFEAASASTIGHAEIARLALSEMPADLQNPEWWAQGTAIAYEQHAGLRVPGQSSAGDFRVSASRTLTQSREQALESWVSEFGGLVTHLGHAVENVRQSQTAKRAFHRFALEGAGKVEVSATPKDETKTILSISHDGMADGERIEEWRAHWKSQLAELQP